MSTERCKQTVKKTVLLIAQGMLPTNLTQTNLSNRFKNLSQSEELSDK
jgi:hypothetical protein